MSIRLLARLDDELEVFDETDVWSVVELLIADSLPLHPVVGEDSQDVVEAELPPEGVVPCIVLYCTVL